MLSWKSVAVSEASEQNCGAAMTYTTKGVTYVSVPNTT